MKLAIVWNGIIRMLKKHKWLSFFLIVQCFVCMILINMIFEASLDTHKSVSKFVKFIGNKSYYCICDDGEENGDFSRYLENQNGEYEKLKIFHECLKNEKEWEFFSVNDQSVDINLPNIPEKFLFQYESGNTIKNEDDSKKNIKCLHISQNVFSEFGIALSEGDEFKSEDFLYKDGDVVPVILGDEYKGILSIGQILDGEYLFENFKFKVVGFLPSLTEIPSGNADGIVLCDRYIIMPAFGIDDFNKEASFFNKASLSQYVNGIIISDLKFADVRDRIDKLSLKTGTMRFLVSPEMSNAIKSLTSVSQDELLRLVYIFIFITIFTIISISVTMNGFIRESYYEYGVRLLIGGTLKFLITQIIGFISLVVSIPMVVSLFAIRDYLSLLILLSFSLTIILLSSIIPINIVKKIDVNNLIRRQ